MINHYVVTKAFRFSITAGLCLLFCLGIFAGRSLAAVPSAEVRAAAAGATILKRTVAIRPRRFLRWWRDVNAAEPVYNTWSWAPEITFAINGPVPSGSQLYVEFDTADGKPWFTQRMATPTLEDDYWENVDHVEDINLDQLEKKAITAQSGLFPFRIRLKNALGGTNEILFSGRYKIATYIPDQKIPEYKGKKEIYVDEDWRLPMAWLWINGSNNNEDAPFLSLQTWFKNSENNDNIEAFVFYNGKQISNVKAGSAEETLTNGVDEKPNRYTLRMFYFYKIRGFNSNPAVNFDNSHFLDKNPGDYEIKILRNGDLSRTLNFTVGKDGKIVDNGVVAANKIGGIRSIIPIKIFGAADGTWNRSAWQTDAFYGNPLTGFTAIP